MNERDLRYFVAIVEAGGLGAAAERLGISQPALTKCVDRLEGALAVTLLARQGRNVQPTLAGQVLHRRAHAILLRMEETMREMADHASGAHGHVRLGAAATMTEALLPAVIARVMREAPGITIELVTGMDDVLRAALREDRLDLLIGPMTAGEDEFDCEPLVSDRVVVAASTDHPLAGRPAAMPEMLDYDWILPPGSVVLRRWLDHSFERAGLARPRVRVEVNSLVSMPTLVGGSNLLSFCSSRKLDTSRLTEIACEGTTFLRSFGLLHRTDSYRSAAVRGIAGFLRAAVPA